MRPTTKLHIAQLVGLIVALISFETLHRLNASGLIYLLLTFCIVSGFYLFAASFRCPRCGARLFPPSRLATPFFSASCPRCGFDTSGKSGSHPASAPHRGPGAPGDRQAAGGESPPPPK